MKPRKPQLNVQLEDEDAATLARIESATGIGPVVIVRALIRQFINQYKATGRLPELDKLVPAPPPTPTPDRIDAIEKVVNQITHHGISPKTHGSKPR